MPTATQRPKVPALEWRAPQKRPPFSPGGRKRLAHKSRCGRYRIEQFLGKRWPPHFVAMRFKAIWPTGIKEREKEPSLVGHGHLIFARGGYWTIIGYHRTLAAAKRTCQRVAREHFSNLTSGRKGAG